MNNIFRQPGKTGIKKDATATKKSISMFYSFIGICSVMSSSAINLPEVTQEEQYRKQLHSIAYTYYHNKEYDKAFSCYKKAADTGDAYAQHQVGEMYRSGLGIPVNVDLAIKYYNKAISGGDVMSFEQLGILTKEGNDKAFESLQYFANHGFIMAYYLMQFYANKGLNKAIKWLENTALKGNICHQSKLGYMYFKGIGVEKDYTKAFLWSYMAATYGDIYAQHRLGLLYLENTLCDYNSSFMWFQKATKQKHLPAFYDLVKLAELGHIEALQYIKTESKNGNKLAQHTVGYMYMHGKLVDQNISKSIRLFKKSSEISESIQCLENLAKDDSINALYALKEIALHKKQHHALDSLERLAENGNMDALDALSDIAEKEDDHTLFSAAFRLQNIVNRQNVIGIPEAKVK